MRLLATCIVLAAMAYGGVGVTKKSGIEEFWTDDYKVFQQVYGKTSDKDIYGERLPSSVTDNGDKKKEASEKRERYVYLYKDPDSIEFDSDSEDPNDHYVRKHSLKSSKRPAKSSVNFVSYSQSKPISQASDPQTYRYLKQLEDYEREERRHHKSSGGFKPYLSNTASSSEEIDPYRSIQDILEAHERNKASSHKNKDIKRKYLKYLKDKMKKPSRSHHDAPKHNCNGGRCRKTGPGYRSRSRPHKRAPTLKKIVVM